MPDNLSVNAAGISNFVGAGNVEVRKVRVKNRLDDFFQEPVCVYAVIAVVSAYRANDEACFALLFF